MRAMIRALDTLKVPAATAAPPATSATAAGTGRPMASARTTRKMRRYPWCAISEKKLFIVGALG